MSTRIKYTPAEVLSFKLVPETCPAIEQAFDTAFKLPDLQHDAQVDAIFAKYNLVVDRKTRDAIYEVMGRLLFNRKAELLDVVRYQGTFPLRLALVERIEEEMRARGEPTPGNHYTGWIDMHQSMQRIRAARLAA